VYIYGLFGERQERKNNCGQSAGGETTRGTGKRNFQGGKKGMNNDSGRLLEANVIGGTDREMTPGVWERTEKNGKWNGKSEGSSWEAGVGNVSLSLVINGRHEAREDLNLKLGRENKEAI